MKPRLIAATVLLILILILILQNTQVVELSLFFWDIRMSRVILILITTLTGFLAGYLVARVVEVRYRSEPKPATVVGRGTEPPEATGRTGENGAL